MRPLLKSMALAAICICLASCIMRVDVEKFTGKEKGMRYSLPSPYLLVTPKSDGTASYDWVYLPDPENEYVVRTWSFMAKYTTDITLDNNLLKKVTAKSDTSGVAAKTFDAAQSVYGARTKAVADAAKTQADRNAAAQKAIADAKLELAQAEAELKVLEDNNIKSPDENWLKAKIKVEQAQKKVGATESAANTSLNAMNAPGGGELKNGQAWGPVLFKVVQTKDKDAAGKDVVGMELVAVNVQQAFDTSMAVKEPEATPVVFKFQDGKSVFPADPKKPLQFVVVADSDIDQVDETKLDLVRDRLPDKQSKVKLTLGPDKKAVQVLISPGPPKGKYVMTLPYSNKPGEKIKSDAQIEFEVK